MDIRIPLRVADRMHIGVRTVTDLLLLLLFEQYRKVGENRVELRASTVCNAIGLRRVTLHKVAGRLMDGIQCRFGSDEFDATTYASYDLKTSENPSRFVVEFTDLWTVAMDGDDEFVTSDIESMTRFETRSALFIYIRALAMCTNRNYKGSRKIPIDRIGLLCGHVSSSPSTVITNVLDPGIKEFQKKGKGFEIRVEANRLGSNWRWIDFDAKSSVRVPVAPPIPKAPPARVAPGRPFPKKQSVPVDHFERKTPSTHGNVAKNESHNDAIVPLSDGMSGDDVFRWAGVENMDDEASILHAMRVIEDRYGWLKARAEHLRKKTEDEFDIQCLVGFDEPKARSIVRAWVVRNGPSAPGLEPLPDFATLEQGVEETNRQVRAGTFDVLHNDRMKRIMTKAGFWHDADEDEDIDECE